MQRHLLAHAIAAALAALAASSVQAASAYGPWQRATAEPAQPVSREQVAQELTQARAAGWQGYGSEVTLDPQPAPRGMLSRSEVVAEYREWRSAGALDEGSEAGPSQATLERRVAMNARQAEQYARAVEAEQQRLAQLERERLAQIEAQRRAAEQTAVAPSGSGTAPADGTAPATTSGETSATLGSGTPTPAPSEPAAPAPSTDAAVDTTRPRSEAAAASAPEQPPLDQAQPSPVR
jgi:translation initiation factor IF-2